MIDNTHTVEKKAKITLELVAEYPSDRLVLRDKPDLQDDIASYGIEVVEDCYEKERERERFIESIWEKPFDEIDPQKIKKFEQQNGTITVEDNNIKSACLGDYGANDPSHLIGTIHRKIKKLNGGAYKSFESYGLYVFVDTLVLYESYVQQVIDEISAITVENRYRFIYLDQYYQFYVCDIDAKTYEKRTVTKEERDSIVLKSRIEY